MQSRKILSLTRLLLVTCVFFGALGPQANAQSLQKILQQEQYTPFVAPKQTFASLISVGWRNQEQKDSNNLVFEIPNQLGPSTMLIEYSKVSKHTQTEHLKLRNQEKILPKLPAYQQKAESRHTIGLQEVPMISGTYRFQGNAKYPRQIFQTYLVHKRDGYVFTLDCSQKCSQSVIDDTTIFFLQFRPQPTQLDLKSLNTTTKKQTHIPY